MGASLVAGVGSGAAADRIGAGRSVEVLRATAEPGVLRAAPSAGRGGVQPDRGGGTPSSTPTTPAVTAEPASPGPTPAEPALPEGVTQADLAAGILAADVPAQGSGELVVVAGEEPAPVPQRPVRTVRVEFERDLAVDGEVLARLVMATLNDPRGWGADGSVSFARTDGTADVRVVLATPRTVDRMCAPLPTRSTYSCGRNGHAALNAERWWRGTEEFVAAAGTAGSTSTAGPAGTPVPDALTVYRQYLVNHEVGHLLGEPHRDCPASGVPAPVMQQQTIRVAPCVPNPWPFPDAG